MRSIRYSRGRKSGAEIDMAPMMDMIFILLIFFIVTTSFVKEAGVEVNRPTAHTSEEKGSVNMVVAVTSEGVVFIEGKATDVRVVRAKMERFLAEEPEGYVVIAADENSGTGLVIKVLDACRLAGVKNLSIAAKKRAGA